MNSLSGIAVIGLTGQSGAGKTTCSEIFKEAGFKVINCDGISHSVSHIPEFLSEAEKIFPGYTDENGLKRRELGTLVFNDPEKLRTYENIIFPYITAEILGEIRTYRLNGERAVILDAPTLFESGMDEICAAVASVIAPMEMKIKRILERDGVPVEFASSRLSSQFSEKFFYDRSDWVIVNDGDFEELCRKVGAVAKNIRERFNA